MIKTGISGNKIIFEISTIWLGSEYEKLFFPVSLSKNYKTPLLLPIIMLFY